MCSPRYAELADTRCCASARAGSSWNRFPADEPDAWYARTDRP
ncbi:hypothetical protein [Nonomuraea sp. SBT364]|nr:hypothetical protein [Nonomuraea sp. SBT364]